MAIKSFACGDTAELWRSGRHRRFANIRTAALKKLFMIDVATDAIDLRSPPGNRLERLVGDRKGAWSIRINDQWRVCFKWVDGHAEEVEIVDYH